MGPTALGKSAIALEIARSHRSVEIVSIDSMAVYRSMDLATAKPSREVLDEIPHHMINIFDPDEECTLSLFQEKARSACDEIRSRGGVPLLVGGTGLYHRAVLDNLRIPAQFPEIRSRLESICETPEGQRELYEQLMTRDPTAASRIEPENTRRLVRAHEVLEGTGELFSSFGPGLRVYEPIPTIQIGVETDLDVLDARADQRVHEWIEQGFVDEVRSLFERPKGVSRTAAQAIGYREFFSWLETGGDIDQPRDATIARTRTLIRRQRSWFRRDPRVQWTNSPDEAVSKVSDAVRAVLESSE